MKTLVIVVLGAVAAALLSSKGSLAAARLVPAQCRAVEASCEGCFEVANPLERRGMGRHGGMRRHEGSSTTGNVIKGLMILNEAAKAAKRANSKSRRRNKAGSARRNRREQSPPREAKQGGSQTVARDYDSKEIQTKLSELGYDVGTIDGQIGKTTRAKIREFQEDHGLEVDGAPSKALLTALTEALDKATAEKESPDEQQVTDVGKEEPCPQETMFVYFDANTQQLVESNYETFLPKRRAELMRWFDALEKQSDSEIEESLNGFATMLGTDPSAFPDYDQHAAILQTTDFNLTYEAARDGHPIAQRLWQLIGPAERTALITDQPGDESDDESGDATGTIDISDPPGGYASKPRAKPRDDLEAMKEQSKRRKKAWKDAEDRANKACHSLNFRREKKELEARLAFLKQRIKAIDTTIEKGGAAERKELGALAKWNSERSINPYSMATPFKEGASSAATAGGRKAAVAAAEKLREGVVKKVLAKKVAEEAAGKLISPAGGLAVDAAEAGYKLYNKVEVQKMIIAAEEHGRFVRGELAKIQDEIRFDIEKIEDRLERLTTCERVVTRKGMQYFFYESRRRELVKAKAERERKQKEASAKSSKSAAKKKFIIERSAP